jgi:hypothetical protein
LKVFRKFEGFGFWFGEGILDNFFENKGFESVLLEF